MQSIGLYFSAARWSPHGTFRTSQVRQMMSVPEGEADLPIARRDF